MEVPFAEGILDAEAVAATARTIAALQLPDGMIQWYPDGHADPWNHVEAAMALATCGLIAEAEAAYEWLADLQRPDGSWHNYYTADGIKDAKLDSNCVAYVATGIWHLWLATANDGVLERYWPMVEAATNFVLDLQTKRGEIIWARHSDGLPWRYALLTGSSSISHSLACAARIAATLERPQPQWLEARRRLVDVIAHQPNAFEPKARWAMDWYYPVMTGAVTGDDGAKMLTKGWDTFVMEGKGVRCVSDRPWVTAAETCECALAYLAVGRPDAARRLFGWIQPHRDHDGAYFTGRVFPEFVFFPADERSSYTSAAVILVTDALYGRNPTSDLFTRHDHPIIGQALEDA